MSPIKSLVQDWFWIGSVAFGLGFSVSLPFNRDLRQSAIAGFAAVPATSAVVLLLQHHQKRQMRRNQITLVDEIEQLESQKQNLFSSLATKTLTLEQLQSQIGVLQAELNQTEITFAAQQLLRQSEIEALASLEAQQQKRQAEISSLTANLEILEDQSHTEQQSLQVILAEKQRQESELTKLQTQILTQQQQKAELDVSTTQKQARQRKLIETVEHLKAEKLQLEAQVAAQVSQREALQKEVVQLSAQLENLSSSGFDSAGFDDVDESAITEYDELYSIEGNYEDIVLLETEAEELTLANLKSLRAAYDFSIESSMPLGFEQPDYTKILWQDKLLPYWKHRDFPKGSRFLGSFRIQKSATDELLSLVGENLGKVGSLTQARLSDRFTDPEENWVKIVTLALSEYAYYYSGDRFWEGFCSRLRLSHSQNTENALREVAERGVDLLGLVRAKGGYRYVSTLWLQSGIPSQNLNQFAQLVQELQETYGWEHLAEAEHSVLAEILFDTCQTQHRGWGTLWHFLESSCASSENPEDERVDPISGQLVQGIAVVAQEIGRQQLSPQVLLNDEDREAFLGNSYLPKNFFLRSWETLASVITLRDSTSNRRRLVSLRPKRLFLELNLESLDTQLILPEQTLWQPKWKDVRGTNCTISEADWEETMPCEGNLEIPELVIPLWSDTQRWECTLRNHNNVELQKWQLSSISPELPCLIFDSMTGEYIPLHQSASVIIGASEILCFTPRDIVVQPGRGIEFRDRGIPSSIRGWRGVHLKLTALEAGITLIQTATEPKVVQWKTSPVEPFVQGLRLQGKQPIYLEVPMLWLPPMAQTTTLNLLIDDVNHKSIIARSVEEITTNQWRSLHLHQWLQAPGRYEVKLWNVSYRWSQRFEIREKYYFPEPAQRQSRIRYDQQDCAHLPIQVETVAKFWAAQLQIDGLWPMESVTLLLSNGQAASSCTLQADLTGILEISVAKFYELLPKSEYYALSYQVLGQKNQQLIELGQKSKTVSIALPITSETESDNPGTIETETINPPAIPQTSTVSKWHLVTIKPRKRNIFCKQIQHRLDNSTTEETGIITFKLCPTDIYADYVLVQVQKMNAARKTLQSIEHFMRLEPNPLTEADVKRMLGT